MLAIACKTKVGFFLSKFIFFLSKFFFFHGLGRALEPSIIILSVPSRFDPFNVFFLYLLFYTVLDMMGYIILNI